MKTKKKQDPLSRKGRLGIIKKVIILLVTMIISLSILMMPCLVGSSLCAPSEVSAKTLADGRNKYIEDILNGRIQELKDEGYVEVSYELNPMVQQVGVSLRTAPMATTGNLEEDMKQAVLKNYLFYANYSSVSENEETIYYFKTPELSDNFITEINKYDKTDFKTETVKKIIGAETSQEILDNAIESKRIIAEKREAARRKEEEARLYTIAAFLLGYVLIDNLTSTEQNALGNWLMLVSQPLCTNGSYNFNKEWNDHLSGEHPDIRNMMNIMRDSIDKVGKIIK